ncbi:MAG: MBL fold metallo-hydrolase, partial [Tepidiformaceae bacterium]
SHPRRDCRDPGGRMSVRLTFVGSGDAFGSGGRFQSCILLQHDGDRTLLDCGMTSLVALERAGVDHTTISTVIVSHLHGDHFGGIPLLVIDGQFSGRDQDLTVVGPTGTRERLTEAMEVLYPRSSTITRRFAVNVVEVIPEDPVSLGAVKVTPFLADHASGAPAHLYRLEVAGVVIAYTGDTAWTDAIVEAASGADLLIAEALFREKEVPYHLNVATLAANRHRLRCGRIVLTHMDSDVLDGPAEGWELAYDGMVLEL